MKPAAGPAQLQEQIQVWPLACPDDQALKLKSSAMLSFLPREMWKDWGCLEKTLQSLLKSFVEYQDFLTKISRIVPEIPGPLHRWISDLEYKLKNVAGSFSSQKGRADKESELRETTAGDRLPLQDLPEGGKASNVDKILAGFPSANKTGLNQLWNKLELQQQIKS